MQQDNNNIETHPLQPFLPANAKLLMLGSFPPPKSRWKMEFYYPNFQNDMWRIYGIVFFGDKNYFIDNSHKTFKLDVLKAFLNEHGIAIYDTAEQVIRLTGNASDKFLQVVKVADITKILQHIPQCTHIMTTGDKATDTLMSLCAAEAIKPTLQTSSEVMIKHKPITLHRLPSSSRAYPLALEQKAEIYRQFFQSIGML